jgi:hypothetical protein
MAQSPHLPVLVSELVAHLLVLWVVVVLVHEGRRVDHDWERRKKE